jgi:hypothetical protein
VKYVLNNELALSVLYHLKKCQYPKRHYTLDCLEYWYWQNTLHELEEYWTDGTSDYDVSYYEQLDVSRNHLPA